MNDCLVEKVAGLEERVVGLEAGGRRAVREAGEGMTMGLEENDLGITPWSREAGGDQLSDLIIKIS